MFITKRIERLQQCLATGLGRWIRHRDDLLHNGESGQSRLSLYPFIKKSLLNIKLLSVNLFLSQIDFRGELEGWVEQVVAGGESGKEARVCNYDWVLDIRRQCGSSCQFLVQADRKLSVERRT